MFLIYSQRIGWLADFANRFILQTHFDKILLIDGIYVYQTHIVL